MFNLTKEEIRDLKARILTRVKFNENSCWEWQLGRVKFGYGKIKLSNPRRDYPVHRVTYMLWKTDPKKMLVLHKCDNPPCCNPNHLFLGTYDTNNKDRAKKGRSRDQYGEKNNMSKLTSSEVLEILQMKGKVKSNELSIKFNVNRRHIERIWKKELWNHLKES